MRVAAQSTMQGGMAKETKMGTLKDLMVHVDSGNECPCRHQIDGAA